VIIAKNEGCRNLIAAAKRETRSMRWKPITTSAVLVLALATLAWWQYREFLLERDLAQETLHRQSHSVMNALVGGIQAHRRRGQYFVDQLQGSLEGLVSAEDILAVGITSSDGRQILAAGASQLLTVSSPIVVGDFWDAAGFRLVELFELPADAGGPGERAGGGRGRQGRGRGTFAETPEAANFESPFSAGGTFAAVLVLDRTHVDDRSWRAARLRGALVAAGTLLLFCVTLAWHVTVRAAGRTRLLETEARHLRDLSQAAAGLAHETRNPLGLVRGWAQRLSQTGFPSQEQQAQADAIVEECDRVTARINQFLAFARPHEPKHESVSVKDVVAELAMLLQPDLEEKSLTLDHKALAADATVHADHELLRQALFNLVQNAVQAAPHGTAVEILMRSGHDGATRIEVLDRGPSVPAEAVESLFTPYFTTRQDGTGLGLAIVRHIASVHGWQAGFTPRPGGGSIFWLDQLHG
jgi:signal transduction histidine kinase